MQPFVATILAALITALAGNWLVQRWQMRNWFSQQRHTANQQELLDLSILFDEMSKSASSRLNIMRELLNSLRSEGSVEEAVENYKIAISSWNVSLHSWFAKITILIDWNTTLDLEQGLHAHFVKVGAKLESLIRNHRREGILANSRVASADAALNSLAGQMDLFLKQMLGHIQKKRDLIRNGRHLKYNESDLSEYSTLELIKTLFVSDVDGIDIIRPA